MTRDRKISDLDVRKYLIFPQEKPEEIKKILNYVFAPKLSPKSIDKS